MVSVLLRLKSSGILNEFPNLAAYVARGDFSFEACNVTVQVTIGPY